MKKTITERGFTLIEIMVSMVISSLVVAGIYGVYTIQQRSYTTQEKVTEIQQRLRSAVDFISRDIRMAGYSTDTPPSCSISNNLMLLKVLPDKFSFQYCEQGIRNTITYQLEDGGKLRRTLMIQGSTMPLPRDIADGIDGIEFQYLQGDAETVTTTASAIRVVRLSILARSTYPDPNYTDRLLHLPGSGSGNATWSGKFNSNPANDNFHRRLLITSIELRNVGL